MNFLEAMKRWDQAGAPVDGPRLVIFNVEKCWVALLSREMANDNLLEVLDAAEARGARHRDRWGEVGGPQPPGGQVGLVEKRVAIIHSHPVPRGRPSVSDQRNVEGEVDALRTQPGQLPIEPPDPIRWAALEEK